MDFRHLEYFVEIAKENNISKAAQNLYVSQSAVNQQLLKLEKELGTQLFVRSRRNWRLTEAGEIYLEGCRRALQIRQDTYRRIADITQSLASSLTVGLTPNRGLAMFTAIYPELHAKYPDIAITPMEMDARSQVAAASRGELDLGFLILPKDMAEGKPHFIDLGSEEMLLLVPADHEACRDYPDASGENTPLPVLDLSRVADIPFSMTRPGSTHREMCDRIFAAAGIDPKILMETTTTSHIAQMTETGQCCGLLPSYYADRNNPRYRCFALPDHPVWHLYLAYRQDAYLTKAAKDYIRLAKKYWSEHLV